MELKPFSQLKTVEVANLTPSEIRYYQKEIGDEEVLEEIEMCKEILSNLDEE